MESYIKDNGRRLILLWVCLIIVGSLVTGYFAISYLRANRDAKIQILKKVYGKEETLLTSTSEEAQNPQAKKVKTGLYVTRISELNIKESVWVVDFYVWFRWKGATFTDPGEFLEVIDGDILSKELQHHSQQGEEYLSQYKIQARITKNFDLTSYPNDNHLLTIVLEDNDRDLSQLQYVVESYNYAPGLTVLGYLVRGSRAWVDQHSYPSSFGEMNNTPEQESIYSQFVYVIGIRRPGWGYYLKMFQGLFASILLALALFLSRPSEKSDRLALGVGSFFAAIANTYFAQTVLPDSGIMTLMDIINGISYIMILMVIISSVISTYLYEMDNKLGVFMDRLCLITFFLCYVALNLVLPVSTLW